jgi:sigma-B regulation protein RsbU (phosphoserine phosphatase)
MIFLLTIVLIAAGLFLAIRIAGTTIRRTIWRLRNRLLVTYLFIAVIPIVLILALAAVGTWIVAGQVAIYLVTSELERRVAGLETQARILSQAKPADREAVARQLAPLIAQRLPGAEILVTGDPAVHNPAESKLEPPSGAWKDYTGFVVKDGKYYGFSMARSAAGAAVVMAPIDADLLARLVPGIGILDITPAVVTASGTLSRRYVAGKLPERASVIDFQTLWLGRLSFAQWEDPAKAKQEVALVVQTRPSAVLNALFGNRMEDAQSTLVLFAVIASLLLVVEVFAMVIGVSLSRTITGAVHGLYEGTTNISKGTFSHRIPVKGKDQLAELGHSFNSMTAQLQSLVEIAREKERMQSELEIASEVQNQLFPRSAPQMSTIELVGVCQAARMVSGDYYDYLRLPDGQLGVAIGDVAGKGISAALLMASIQSIMRTQLAAGSPSGISTAAVVAQLNRQLYANTSPEKYATFFFGIYDENSRILTYTNAGHLPPLLLHDSEVRLLEVTGTVVGAFPSIRYEEKSIRIDPGDVFIAYTDGVTEPEDAYGEEFGTERLVEVATRHRNAPPAEIAAKIMEAVVQWSAGAEMPDDMTVVIAKGLA